MITAVKEKIRNANTEQRNGAALVASLAAGLLASLGLGAVVDGQNQRSITCESATLTPSGDGSYQIGIDWSPVDTGGEAVGLRAWYPKGSEGLLFEMRDFPVIPEKPPIIRPDFTHTLIEPKESVIQISAVNQLGTPAVCETLRVSR